MTDSVQLVESVPSRVRLNEAQLRALEELALKLAGQAAWWGSSEETPSSPRAVRIEARGDLQYDVTVLDAIGAIGLPNLVLRVTPKIPFEHFAYIARHAIGIHARTAASRVSLSSGSNFLELMAQWFLDEVETLVRYGLTRDYREVKEWAASVRGSVVPTPTVERWLSGRAEMLTAYEKFDYDTPFNRILKAACRVLSNAEEIAETTRRRAARSVRGMSEIGDLQSNDAREPFTRSTEHYRGAIELGMELMRGHIRGLGDGGQPFHTFLIKTPGLVETGLRNILSLGLAPVVVSKGGKVLLPSAVRANPDLLFGRFEVTGDVKYKIALGYWDRGDLAQAVFFAAAYKVKNAFILTFGGGTIPNIAPLEVGDISVTRVTWDLSSSTQPEESALRVVKELRRLCARSI
ncbi:5-methylcytosine restriction system specificity protein McrC [Conyzicola sp.]|uniref:5-methylcytosine restriction system specificity protein McrC n=1 Tax=Conyzicola sp. TaxID=1969404 RepID=UPI003989A748